MLASTATSACVHVARVTSVFQSLPNNAHIPLPQDGADACFTAPFLCYVDISAAKQHSV